MVASSSTSSSRPLTVLGLALVLVLLVELLARGVLEGHSRPVDHLTSPPREGAVWLMGTSILDTAIDSEALSTTTGVPVEFEYRGARYTDGWYLITRNALPDADERPLLVVWGFRPHIGSHPALRLGAGDDLEVFEIDGDPVFDRLAQLSDDDPWIGERLSNSVGDSVRGSAVWSQRAEADELLDDWTLGAASVLLRPVAGSTTDLVDSRVRDGGGSLADLMVWLATEGAVSDAAELVDDLGEVVDPGPVREFDDSFIPHIAANLQALGLEQLVLVFPQRDVAAGNLVPQEAAFAADAIEYFESEGIEYIDFFGDHRFVEADFGGGDHLAYSGRALITQDVAGRIVEMAR